MHQQEQITNYEEVEQPQDHLIPEINETQSFLGDSTGVGNLDRVRDILFGSHMRNFEKKFNRLEERLLKECANLRDETRKRIDSLETYLRKEVELVTNRLTNDKIERDETVEELAQDLKNTIKILEKKIAKLDEQVTKSEHNLLQHTLDLSNNLNDEMRQKSEEILAILEREAQKIRKDKADRSTLVSILTEMAMRLNEEFDS